MGLIKKDQKHIWGLPLPLFFHFFEFMQSTKRSLERLVLRTFNYTWERGNAQVNFT